MQLTGLFYHSSPRGKNSRIDVIGACELLRSYSVWQLASTSLPRVLPGIAAFSTIQVFRGLESTCFRPVYCSQPFEA